MQVLPARTDELGAALRLYFEHVADAERDAHVERALALVQRGDLPADGLLVCHAGEICIGVIAVLPLPGAAGLVWPPHAAPGVEKHAVEDLLVHSAAELLRQRGAKFAQSILGPADAAFAGPLVRHGFRRTTTLVYLQKDLTGRLDNAAGLAHLRWQTVASCNLAIFQRTLLASYEETLDCPELNGLRSADEIVAGYQAVPGCRLEHWWLAWQGDQPVGVLITLPAEETTTWELAYVGLVPTARGRGLGTMLTRLAMGTAQSEGATRMTLTADERNALARRMYQQLGFQEFDRREVHLKVF